MISITLLITTWLIFCYDQRVSCVSIDKKTLASFCGLSCGIRQNSLCANQCKEKDCKIIDADKQWRYDMVNLHNQRREMIASGEVAEGGNGEATGMNALSYDIDLEMMATCWIAQITTKNPTLERDKCGNTKKFRYVNQNIWSSLPVVKIPDQEKEKEQGGGGADTEGGPANKSTTTTIEPPAPPARKKRVYVNDTGEVERNKRSNDDISKLAETVIDAWYDEINGMTKERIISFKTGEPMVDNFAQMMWAKSTHFGCGRCKTKTDTYVACNYGMGGNLLRAPVYEFMSEGAEKCPGNKTNQYMKNLCGDIKYPAGFWTKGFGGSVKLEAQIVELIFSLIIIHTFIY